MIAKFHSAPDRSMETTLTISLPPVQSVRTTRAEREREKEREAEWEQIQQKEWEKQQAKEAKEKEKKEKQLAKEAKDRERKEKREKKKEEQLAKEREKELLQKERELEAEMQRAEKELGLSSQREQEKYRIHSSDRAVSYKDKFHKMREKYDRATSTHNMFERDLELLNAKMKKLQAENDLLLDAMFLAEPGLYDRYFPGDPAVPSLSSSSSTLGIAPSTHPAHLAAVAGDHLGPPPPEGAVEGPTSALASTPPPPGVGVLRSMAAMASSHNDGNLYSLASVPTTNGDGGHRSTRSSPTALRSRRRSNAAATATANALLTGEIGAQDQGDAVQRNLTPTPVAVSPDAGVAEMEEDLPARRRTPRVNGSTPNGVAASLVGGHVEELNETTPAPAPRTVEDDQMQMDMDDDDGEDVTPLLVPEVHAGDGGGVVHSPTDDGQENDEQNESEPKEVAGPSASGTAAATSSSSSGVDGAEEVSTEGQQHIEEEKKEKEAEENMDVDVDVDVEGLEPDPEEDVDVDVDVELEETPDPVANAPLVGRSTRSGLGSSRKGARG